MAKIAQNSKKLMFYSLTFLSLGFGRQAMSCLPALQGFKSQFYTQAGAQGDLCQLADRYAAAKRALALQGVDALQIADVRAPRFIQLNHWEARKNQRVPFRNNYDPRTMYDRPGQETGSVWNAWNRAALDMDRSAAGYYEQVKDGRFQGLDLSLAMILRLHGSAMGNIEAQVVTEIRRGPAIGQALTRSTAPRVTEIQNISQISYPRRDSSGRALQESMVRWISTSCYEDLPSHVRQEIAGSGRRIRNDLYPVQESPFADSAGVQRQCGYFVYVPETEVTIQLEQMQSDVNARLIRLASAQELSQKEIDPILVAARAQRWFVSIHPFFGGNGRSSRLIMDQILQSFGLPAPQIADVNADLTTSEDLWAAEIAKGIEKTIQTLENCVQNPLTPQCQRVPWSQL